MTQFDGYEDWTVGPFYINAVDYWGENDVDKIALKCAWNDWPETIGIYPVTTSLEELKKIGLTWLREKLKEWDALVVAEIEKGETK